MSVDRGYFNRRAKKIPNPPGFEPGLLGTKTSMLSRQPWLRLIHLFSGLARVKSRGL